ncbi:unnamed protein product [Albugo candida]|uniref:Uncharacterized protein n=1 Tax=Albugo candida TaxID=65357 RepID=A0A024GD15_9STRA|nr:unnamed protein product [Albugo candida]|eukprot:CCI44582.1 unnamed protein product [Albugo candida]
MFGTFDGTFKKEDERIKLAKSWIKSQRKDHSVLSFELKDRYLGLYMWCYLILLWRGDVSHDLAGNPKIYISISHSILCHGFCQLSQMLYRIIIVYPLNVQQHCVS